MPAAIVKSFAQKSGKSVQEVEKIWDELKDQYGENYARITGTLKKILKINESGFKAFLNEEKDSDYNGLSANGQLVTVEIKKGSANDVMQINIKGSKMLTKLRSAENIKDDYKEEYGINIEKIWAKLADKQSSKLEKLVQQFEKGLNNIIIEMEKDTEHL